MAVTVASLCNSGRVLAQASPDKSGGDELGSDDALGEDAPAANDAPEQGSAPEEEPEAQAPQVVPAAPTPPPPPPPSLPSPFVFTLKGTIAATLYAQDKPIGSGNGTGALFSPIDLPTDSWFLGGDIRTTRLTFTLRGPEVLAAIPTGVVEFELFGGQQITTVPGVTNTIMLRNAMGVVVGTGTAPGFTSSAQGDESLLPRMRTAYLELNWGTGTDILRIGQFHNLLLAMISASMAHPGVLGYSAGQLGWRSPGITYLHKFKFSEDVALDGGLQISRNSWIDNVPTCGAGMAPPITNCLPSGVSLGEASMLPQFEGRLILSGGKTESPWPYYAPTVWQLHVVGHWDVKDLSGVGNVAMPPATRDVMNTMIVEAGGKLKLGPVLIAANGWYGKNSGNVFGNTIQQQTPDKPDVWGFGTWGQVGFSLSQQFSLWVFAGIDRPDEQQAIAAAFTRAQNVQLAGMLAYSEGPIIITLEWFHVATTSFVYAPPGTPAPAPGTPPVPPGKTTVRGNQPSVTLAYSF